MISYQQLLIKLNESDHSDEHEYILKKGKEIDPNFWENFIKLTNNSEELANLLEVDSSKVASWSHTIQNKLNLINNKAKNVERKNVISTGE